eukprot:TRINITY_DN7528_c0_g2_i1.p1 TRINITY_DN7528_c0_g2~~TRINITY_DN7528_c0_g2_i1.p1  ORF type:complete len:211 (-),score=12.69 TRINITY_DN7528_c0_g2_i1:1186-1818(-)
MAIAVLVPCGLSSCSVIEREAGAESASKLRGDLRRRGNQAFPQSLAPTCSLRQREDDCVNSDDDKSGANLPAAWAGHLGKSAVATLAAALVLLSPGDATAASGGRIGGSAFRSERPAPSRSYNNSSRTNIYIRPPPLVGPPPVVIGPPSLFGGYGRYGGFGLPYFSPPPVVVGPAVAVGFSMFDVLPLLFGMFVLGGIARLFRRRDDYYD